MKSRAQRQYDVVDPENRLVAHTLERRWNEKLQQLQELEQAYTIAQRTQRLDVTPQERQQILRLAADLPAVWRAPMTTQAERKELLGLLVKQIALTPVEAPQRQTRIHLLWHTTATTELTVARLRSPERVRTPPQVIEAIAALAVGRTDTAIAEALNAQGLASGRGRPFTAKAVAWIRHHYQIRKPGSDRQEPPARWPVLTDAIPPAPSQRNWASASRRFITGGHRGFSPPSRSCLGALGGVGSTQRYWRSYGRIFAGRLSNQRRSILNTSSSKVHYEESIAAGGLCSLVAASGVWPFLCFPGLSRVTLSTPGVFLPWFSVTRRTARALPLNEWVSRCCKACTLCHLPAFVALTIRACSRRTVSLTVFQWMECQSVERWETAPAECSAVICIAPLIGSSRSLVHPHRREVCPLSRRVMLQPVSAPLQDGIRFFPPPYPHRHWLALRLSYLPCGRSDTGLPRSTRLTRTG